MAHLNSVQINDCSNFGGYQLSVLLVEDSPVQQTVMTQWLKQMGHQVTVASNGLEAVSAVKRDTAYDVILMDCQMPVMDGFQASRLIREFELQGDQQSNIIGISATASSEDCQKVGMNDFRSKPISKVTLKEVLGLWVPEKKDSGTGSSIQNNSAAILLLIGIMLSLACQMPASAKSNEANNSRQLNAPQSIPAQTSQSKLPKPSSAHAFLSGVASWYGIQFHGRRTASGQIFDMNKLTAAHLTLPLSSRVLVENPKNGRSVVISVNDRGPYIKNRVIDLSHEAAKQLGMLSCGIAYVNYTVLPSERTAVSLSSNQTQTH